jgi:hypothetical protein
MVSVSSSYYQYEKEQLQQQQSQRLSWCSIVGRFFIVIAALGVGSLVVYSTMTPLSFPTSSSSYSSTMEDDQSTSHATVSASSQQQEEELSRIELVPAVHIGTTQDTEGTIEEELEFEEEAFVLHHSIHEQHTGNIMLESGILNNNVRYYSCNNFVSSVSGNNHPEPNTILDIVLLQSNSYTIDDWKRSGMLSYFCNATLASIAPAVRVVALDLPPTATHTVLREVLSDLVAGLQTHPSYPIKIAGLVTPSASGSIVMDWLLASSNNPNEDSTDEDDDYDAQHGDLRTYVNSWIPVASNGLLHIPQVTIEPAVSNLPILSIYGDQDIAGKRSSTLLEQSSSSNQVTVQELKGRHPVYFESPKDFVQTVLRYLVQQQLQRILDQQQ